MKLEINKKELEVLNLFISGNDNPNLFGADATVFWDKKSLIKYVEPLRQKVLKLRKDN
jgi:hypothetical protein|tara:strand:+ start:198 stop:371 length:174 start_codon:yes stop_codon:yes gene_type:complete